MSALDGINVAPSILAADFSRLGSQVQEVMDAGARVIHVDVMDGHFVPPITMGPLAVEALDQQVHDADGFLDVHLMIEQPERHIDAFASAGADSITIHREATAHVNYALNAIREKGCVAGLALNPGTPFAVRRAEGLLRPAAVHDREPRLGRPALHRRLGRADRGPARRTCPTACRSRSTAASTPTPPKGAAAAGATLFVAGSSIFGAPEPGEAYSALVEAVG